MKKKFKVRIVYYTECKYVVQYAYYYFFKFWNGMYEWIGYPFYTYNPILLDYKDALKFMYQLNSIDDVNAFHKEQQKQRDKDITEHEKNFKINSPVKVEYKK
jgi:hypothetical protein